MKEVGKLMKEACILAQYKSGDFVRMFEGVIPETIRIQQAGSDGCHVVEFDYIENGTYLKGVFDLYNENSIMLFPEWMKDRVGK